LNFGLWNQQKAASRESEKYAKYKIANSKLEIRNSKQFQNGTNQKITNKPISDFGIGILVFGFVSDFGAPVKTGKVL
jgi:hypothetical protein